MIPKTKIIATLGPASSSETVLRKMFVHGLDIVRLNFSHGDHASHEKMIESVQRLNRKMRRAIKIMQDLEGYRIRVGRLSNQVSLRKGESYYFTQEDVLGRGKDIPFDFKGPVKLINKGSFIYIDDGKIVLKVKRVWKSRLEVKAVISGVLKERKGINIPGMKFKHNALTQKDKDDVQVAIEHKLDYIAQSFVRSADDISMLRDVVRPCHAGCRIFAKVENKEAIANIDEIIDEADGIIVARGDLGVSIPFYKVPMIQKEIIRKCVSKGKPAVVATQMLDSMSDEVFPTRAEVSDVANAVLDKATHLLLSGETATGKYPCQAVDAMNKIIKYTELCMRRKWPYE